jgi:holo-[acyl-carrier protein] synthase
VIVGLGTDVVEVARFRAALGRRATLAARLLTPGERAYCEQQHDPVESMAARFAAKEAVMKALGVGLGDVDFHDVDVERDDGGAPSLALSGRARALAEARGVVQWHVSLSHTATTAMAVVIAIGG